MTLHITDDCTVELHTSMQEMLTQPTRLTRAQVGQLIVVVSTKRRLGMTHQK
jgi:hypothetical protein